MAKQAEKDIEAYLSKADPHLGRLIKMVIKKGGKQSFTRTYDSHFHAFTRSIVSQQLSVKAAATIYGRFQKLVGGKVTPRRVQNLTIEQMRSIGLSFPKARYMHNLAAWFSKHGKKINDTLSDDELIELLTEISGIGVWTVQMFLMFYMKRPDVMPARDLGIQKGVQLVYGLKKKAAPGYIMRKTKHWQPYRSIACLYLWQAFNLDVHKEF
ncbi:MAG: DNA-3-methyladenine glycosylase 2 family protein [Alphaproteobacteria bacterium]